MHEPNHNSRIEAFCDGVFAIALTLLIIDVRLPSNTEIISTADFWHALKHTAPTIFAFVLSFIIILITWVNHHNILKLVNKPSSSFIYANGLLLLTVVFTPFPTSLMGEYIFSGHAAPAVILYNATFFLQAVGWVLMTSTILKDNLVKNEKGKAEIIKAKTYGYYSCVVYALLAILANWIPIIIALITVLLWIFWLIVGIRIRPQVVE
jgi:uncharacterized membrane protein